MVKIKVKILNGKILGYVDTRSEVVQRRMVRLYLLHISTSKRMVENDKKHYKIIQNILFSSCLREAHVRPM